jgi:hypothetical protein
MSVSASTRTQLQATSDPHGVLELLQIDHASFASPVLIVNDTRDWTIGADTYVALPFACKLPNDARGENPRAQLQIDNVGRELTAAIEGLPVGAELLGTFKLVSRATPTVVDYQFIAQLSGISITPTAVTCTMGADDTMRQTAVRVRFDPQNTPGLFPG